MSDPVSAEQWRKAHDLVDELLDLPPEQRDLILRERCGDDAALEAATRKWLAACEHESGFLDKPPASLATLIGSLPAGNTPFEPGTRIGPYRLLSVAGVGGMGTVFLAERDDGEFTRRVALKLMRAMAGDGAALTKRFRAERQILATLEHPNIARLLDGGLTTDGIPYYVMEYVEGQPLDKYVAEQNLSLRERLQLFRQTAAAVRFAHQRLVVHRDLKPSNILVSSTGEVKLVDFGIAKVIAQHNDDTGPAGVPQTMTGVLGPVMTPEYASPEQFRGEAITVASDVYSLGVVLYQLLTGQLPFKRGKSLADLEVAVTTLDPARPSDVTGRRELRGDLDTIMLVALRKDPARRYGSVEAFDADVGRHLDGLPVSARPDTLGYRLGKFVTRHRWPVLAATIVAILLTWSTVSIRRQSARATREAARAAEVSQFLISLLTVPYPYNPDDRTMSMRDLLDSAAARLTGDLADEARDQPSLLEALAMGYYGMGVYGPAQRLQRQAMRDRAANGEDQGNVEDSRSMLGEISMALGDLETARASYDTVVAYYRRKYSDTSQWVGTFAVGQGSAQRAQGEVKLAAATFQEARDNLRRHLPDRLLPLANSLTNLGHTYLELGQLADGEAAYREAIAVRKQARASAIELAHAHGNLGRLLAVAKRFAEADSFLTEAERIMHTAIDDSHPQMTSLMSHRAQLALSRGNMREALRLAQETVRRQDTEEGANHWRVGPNMLLIGEASLALGDRETARRSYAQALRITQARERVPSPRQAEAIAGLGMVALADGNRKEARSQLERASQILTGVIVPGDPRLVRINTALATIPAEP